MVSPEKWLRPPTAPRNRFSAQTVTYRMLRRPSFVFISLMLAASLAFGQFGGGRFPGQGGRSGRGNGGNTQRASTNSQVHGPTETLTGSVRELNGSDLIIAADEDRVVLIQIQSATKYLSTMGKVKASDIEPGDHVTVEATRDENDHYYSKTITLNKKGTAEEKTAALQAASAGTSSSGGSGDSDPDRPRLRRSDSEASAAPAPDPAPRAARSAPAAAPVAAPIADTPNTDVSSSQTARRRPAVSQPSSTPVSVASTSAPAASSSRSTDDSGPPVLRRSGAADTANADAPQPTRSDRPSLSADDVNGVTRLPQIADAAASDASAPRPVARIAGSGDDVIDQARDAAFSFNETLPNYVVKQITSRYQSANSGRSWQPLDIVTTDLIFEDGKERYTNVMVNGKPTKYIEQTGSWSEGEFASMLLAVLSPGTNADFRNQRSTTIVNRPAWRYDYTVEQPRSSWTLHADGQTFTPGYTGAIWIDKATSRVLRIEISARGLPRNFPLDSAESSVDYDFVSIGAQKVLLPSHSDALSCTRGAADCSRNGTDFRNYRKYGADSSISFEGTEK